MSLSIWFIPEPVQDVVVAMASGCRLGWIGRLGVVLDSSFSIVRLCELRAHVQKLDLFEEFEFLKMFSFQTSCANNYNHELKAHKVKRCRRMNRRDDHLEWNGIVHSSDWEMATEII